jgi:hypothetical protein
MQSQKLSQRNLSGENCGRKIKTNNYLLTAGRREKKKNEEELFSAI